MNPERCLVLASRSPYRAELARELCAALQVTLRLQPAHVDERAVESEMGAADPVALAVRLARTKARTVSAVLAPAARLETGKSSTGETIVIGGDQLLVATSRGLPELLHQPGTIERAIEQLCSLSGTTHLLVNGLVAIRTDDRAELEAADVYRVTMRQFSRHEASEYVRRCLPIDCVGAYRIEDDAGLIEDIEGEDRSGVIGFPFPAIGRLLHRLGWSDALTAAAGLSQSGP